MRHIEDRLAQRWAATGAVDWVVATDPTDDSLVARVPVSTADDVDRTVRAARSAQREWARRSPAEWGTAVAALADAVDAAAADLARLTTREMGRPLEESRAGVTAAVDTLRQYAQLGPVHRGRSLAGDRSAADLMVPEPRGVVAAITPWNDPVAVSCGLIGAALATGNAVIHKPSERTPATGWLLGDLAREVLPGDVLSTLSGGPEIGQRLVEGNLDVIAHVGSTATGRRIVRAAALTGAKTLLENGGNDPLIVDSTVDPAWAAGQAALGAFANSGQICVSVERIYVHEAIAEDFVAELAGLAGKWSLGPLVDRRLRDAVHAQVTGAVDEGAVPLCGAEIPDGPGAYYPATVLTGCTEQMAVLAEETFGPVAPVAVVGSFDEGLARACRGRYGLAATVLTASMERAQRAWRELPVGTVKVNEVFGGAPGGSAHPRRESGHGYGYGPELLDEFTATKVVHLAPYPSGG